MMDHVVQSGCRANVKPFFLNRLRQSAHAHFLEGFSDEALCALAEKAGILTYPKNAIVISADHEVEAFYIILSGKIRSFVSGVAGREVTLSFQESGSYFGEVAILTRKPMSVSIVTVQETVCAVVSKNYFGLWLCQYPEVAFILLNNITRTINQLTHQVKQMTLLDSYGLITTTLEAMAVAEGNVSVIRNTPSQQTLASMLGVSRETVNRLISRLIKNGYVSMNNKTLVIHQKLPSI